MARLFLVALALACGAGGGSPLAAYAYDYSGGHMPQYSEYVAADVGGAGAGAVGGTHALTDYRGHSPDAPALLDYKYEEQPSGYTEKQTKVNDDADIWKKPSKKQRRDRDAPRSRPLDDGDSSPDSEPRSERRRHSRHRTEVEEKPRRRRRRPSGNDERSRQRVRPRPRRPRGRNDYLDSVDYHNDNTQIRDNDNDLDSITGRESTEIIIRRKPRDKIAVESRRNDELDSGTDERMEPVRKLKDNVEDSRRMRPVPTGGGAPIGGNAAPPPEGDDYDDVDVAASSGARGRGGERGRQESTRDYHEYGGDYYDMSRVDTIKNKLPMLLRRTTTRRAPAPATETTTAASTDLLAILRTDLRTHSQPPPSPAPASPVYSNTASAGAARDADLGTGTAPRTKSSDIQLRTSKTKTSTTKELSLAEKSRLSILKKAYKKDSAKGSPSKPPVLLQVTSQLPTVVMVEPLTGSGEDPWMRARGVEQEPPQRLERVKKLMREKLVARARNIADLTENWDDLVCDYIDVSLLDAEPPPTSLSPPRLVPLLSLLVATLALLLQH